MLKLVIIIVPKISLQFHDTPNSVVMFWTRLNTDVVVDQRMTQWKANRKFALEARVSTPLLYYLWENCHTYGYCVAYDYTLSISS